MRQFIPGKNPDASGRLTVEGKDFAYLCRVLRLETGDAIEVRLPDASLVRMRLTELDADSRRAVLENDREPKAPGDGEVTRGVGAKHIAESFWTKTTFYLFQFLPKPPVFETILRQAAETGVHTVFPLQGDFSQMAPWGDFSQKMPRLERLLREARQQSGSPVATVIAPLSDARGAASWWQDHRGETSKALLLSESAPGCVSLGSLALHTAPQRVAIAVGAEGGMSPAERAALESAGFVPVHFAINVLRCDTAALYGMAAVQSAVMGGYNGL
jgi:16S rRNA (uracil1498-N3)-methyltransferase